jgi:hypothetical protein
MYTSTSTRLTALLLALFFIWTGCDTVDPETESAEAPAAVPEQAFELDVSLFDQEPAAGKNGRASHFLAAVWRVSIANLVTGSILYYPAMMTHAIQHTPPLYSEGGYIWAADTLIDGQVHSIELKARLADSAIDWTMRVSGIDDRTGDYLEDFVLYTARTGAESKTGDFQVYFPIEGVSRQVMDGAYAIDSDTESTLSFSIPADIDDIGGLSAVYRREGLWTSLDLEGPEGDLHYIQWHAQTHEDSITASDYNNGDEGCWNTHLFNTDCPMDKAS